MDIRWLDPADPAPGDLAGAVAVLDAANAADSPRRIAHTTTSLTATMRHGWDGDPELVAVAADAQGRVAGVLQLGMPRWDNTHLAYAEVAVDPLRRCAGIGRRLADVAIEAAQADRRTVLALGAHESAAADGFAKALRLDRASEEVERRQDVMALDWPALDRLEDDAARRSTAYEVVRLPRWTPTSALDEVARLTGAINDAPTDDLDLEDEVYTAPRIRAFEAAQLALDRRIYRLGVRERATGALVGHTLVGVDGERPGYGWQYDTSVLREHRGHRLGLRLKLGMLRWLAEAEPQLRLLDTSNAASNAHMIAVNEALGYRVVGTFVVWQRHL